jgi:hypothetical protein
MKNHMNWILRVMVLVAAVMMVISFAMPWWIGKFSQTTGIWIYGWGLRHNLAKLAQVIAQDVTPLYQIVFAWVYVGISIAFLLFSAFIKREIAVLIQGVIGVSYIVYSLVAMYGVIANRTKVFDIALQGISAPNGGTFSVQSDIQPGFYLALATGTLIILLAILRFAFDRNKTVASI